MSTNYYQKNRERLLKKAKERYRNNPEKYRKRIKKTYEAYGKKYWIEWYHRLKLQLFFALGGKCEKCGYDKLIMQVYDIHHVDPNDKEKDERMSMGHLTKKQVQKLIKLHKEGKVKLLCCRCHREEHDKISSLS